MDARAAFKRAMFSGAVVTAAVAAALRADGLKDGEIAPHHARRGSTKFRISGTSYDGATIREFNRRNGVGSRARRLAIQAANKSQ